MESNTNLPFCKQTHKETDHGKLIIFFAHHQSSEIMFPETLSKHVETGCKVVIITFDWKHFNTAEKIASKDKYGTILAFNIGKRNLDSYSRCSMSCYCGTGVNQRSDMMIQSRDIAKLMFKPAFIETCGK